ncbi:hypothetical protein CSIM01_00520 [Colletotrichum simmondsii]|uniref:Uncharacterized protein n=1 Tax=Colletotrichum simmondsii TaxID=703756 RepID=A0A135SIV8_9PEZI|nr:hypothetical protein CSIM01_00520 [Colletotrichum simmondsii]
MGGEADQSLSKYQRQPAHPRLASNVNLNLVNFAAAVFQESCKVEQVSEDWAPVLGEDSVGRHLQYSNHGTQDLDLRMPSGERICLEPNLNRIDETYIGKSATKSLLVLGLVRMQLAVAILREPRAITTEL